MSVNGRWHGFFLWSGDVLVLRLKKKTLYEIKLIAFGRKFLIFYFLFKFLTFIYWILTGSGSVENNRYFNLNIFLPLRNL